MRRSYAKMPVMEGFGSLSDAWERHAARWERWTRVVGHDVYYEQLNWPAFHALVPPAGRRTLDIGCGEGQVGRVLAAEGHRLAGIDSSPTLAGLAREAGGYEELVCGDATELPWEAESSDLALAFMSPHDMDDLAGAVAEAARCSRRAGACALRSCIRSTAHPKRSMTTFVEHRFAEELELDGLHMTFEGVDRPLEAYTRVLSRVGFLSAPTIRRRTAAGTSAGVFRNARQAEAIGSVVDVAHHRPPRAEYGKRQARSGPMTAADGFEARSGQSTASRGLSRSMA